ncbi:Zein-binding domain-containing protein [Cephalotus follicularis]|uniref:Zein-binding domain-containing protein n=1 Tax=Cephalotus follicularis TaxID=3775 RepID=A0A1Q3CKY4_CEPFO|nr:Zein-binding domain-containing protein [Cephalotus follicularis]
MVEMAVKGYPFVKVQKNLQGFTDILTYAACEWFLIFFLLIDAALSYLLTKFAHYCDLQLPCIFCSRLDHALGNEKPGFYRNLLCSNHRSEISSLITCHIHGKLADGHSMCENCLFSFTNKNKSNLDLDRLYLVKLGFDAGSSGLQSSFVNMDFIPVPMSMKSCSCCNKPWRSRTNVQRFSRLPPPGSAVTKPKIPLQRRLGRQDSLKKMREKFSGPATSYRLGKSGFVPLSQVGYTKLKITSDTESDFPFSDDDDGSSVVHDINESAVLHASKLRPKELPNDGAPAKLLHHNTWPSPLDGFMLPDVSEPHDMKSLAHDVDPGHDLGELKWQQADQKTFPSALPELISLDDVPPPANIIKTSIGVSTQNPNSFSLSELSSLVDAPRLFDVVEVRDGASSDNSIDIPGTSKIGEIKKIKHEDNMKSVSTTSKAGIKIDLDVNDTARTDSTNGNPNGLCNLSKEKETFGFVAEKLIMKEHKGVNEDLKLLLAHNTSGQGIVSSLSNTSPRVQGHGNDLQINGPAMIERTGSAGLESLDGSSVSEIEGESIVDRLKRQVEYNRRCMNDLYKELEEERSASAVATNQAMAMITRLQEEKAALHMEALQYLRMMEEQAEYDVEALEKANDLLADKEKEIQDLEAELEYYRLQFPDESMVETLPEKISEFKDAQDTTVSGVRNDTNDSCKTEFPEVSGGSDKPVVKSQWSEFEEERLYVSQQLKGLDKKLHQFTHHGTLRNSSYIGDGTAAANAGCNKGEFGADEDPQRNLQLGENGFPKLRDLSVFNGTGPAAEVSDASTGEDKIASNHVVAKGHLNSIQYREVDLVALENEISYLNDRLEALEADRSFLQHNCYSLQRDNKGEMSHQLQELRKIGIRSRCRSVP